MDNSNNGDHEDDVPVNISVLQVVGSVLAAMFGVQSQEMRERDFKHGKIGVFIAAGIVFGLLFIATLYLIVTLVLHNAR